MAKDNSNDVLAKYTEMPKNLEAEANFLGALILDGKLIEKVRENIGTLDENDFFSEKNRIIYRTILGRAATTDDFNTTVLCADLENKGLLDKAGGIAYVGSLTELTGPSSAIVEYGQIIIDTSRRRKLISVCEHIEKISYASFLIVQ